MPRLFVALRPPRHVRATLRTLMADVPEVRWQSDAQLHLTLRYIGDVDAATADRIAGALATISAEPVAVRLAGVGTFDRGGRIHTLWAGVAPYDALCRLQAAVDRAIAGIVPEPEPRPFVPHITIARRALGAGGSPAVVAWVARHAALQGPCFTFRSVALYDSIAGEDGIIYQNLMIRRLHF